MRFHALHCHPACPAPRGIAVAASATRLADGDLRLDYRLSGRLADLRLPEPAPPTAADGLWQHTCCEAFIAAAGDATGYREFNLAPSGQWAAYDFADYRQRNTHWLANAKPRIACIPEADAFLLHAEIPAGLLPDGEALLIGLTVVIETLAGETSYWALAHPADRPDFHLRRGFTLTLNPP